MQSPIEQLKKFLQLEQNRNCDNKAVMGGLDKILPAWQKDTSASNLETELIDYISGMLKSYPDLTPEERNHSIEAMVERLNNAQPQSSEISETSQISDSGQSASRENKERRTNQDNSRNTRSTHTPVENLLSFDELDVPLTAISGIGPSYAKSLNNLGVRTLGELLYFFPRRYDNYSQLKPIKNLTYDEVVTVIATVQNVQTRSTRNKKMQITEAVVSDETGFLRLNWFNKPWIGNQLHKGDQVVLSGKIDMYLGRLVMNNPELEKLEQEHLHTNRIVPVYPLTARLGQRWLRRQMHKVVQEYTSRIKEYLPRNIRQYTRLPDLSTALHQVHFPSSEKQLENARRRLAFDEIFLLQLGLLRQKRDWQQAEAAHYSVPAEKLDALVSTLPFTLTNAQKNSLNDICADLDSGQPMNRLLQGDVGSGKTVIAALAAAVVTTGNAQVALMAPTGILAEQHLNNLRDILTGSPEAALQPEEIVILVGSTSPADKENVRYGLEQGTIKIVVGTHALIEDPVIFSNLQLVIVDEQHRFGVAQRATLRQKGANPHLLVMTATPIPRSMALTVYGDLDLTVMDEMPVGRQPVETHLMSPVERERAYTLIRSQINAGQQAFIIYPLIEQGDSDQDKAAVEEHHRLQNEVFSEYKLGLLHGRLKADDKDQVMKKFRDGEFQILVSTSVIEVGLDIPNATVILIEAANRFGLAQLHQFRGRVGRGAAKSYCLLIPDRQDAIENERLQVMAQTNDGFILAEKDLEQRGPGEFLGNRQSGFSELKIASLTDIQLIELARKQAQRLFNFDPEFSKPFHSTLSEVLDRFWAGGKGDVS
jgi:ATP-dependent DNA helicase RecG